MSKRRGKGDIGGRSPKAFVSTEETKTVARRAIGRMSREGRWPQMQARVILESLGLRKPA